MFCISWVNADSLNSPIMFARQLFLCSITFSSNKQSSYQTNWRVYLESSTRRLATTNRKPLAYGSSLAKVSERLHSHIPSDCKVTWVYVPIYMSICGTRSGWRQCSYEVEGLPDACHIKQASGSSLPALLFGVDSIDQINLQAEVTVSGIKLFSHMAGYEYRSRYQRVISSV